VATPSPIFGINNWEKLKCMLLSSLKEKVLNCLAPILYKIDIILSLKNENWSWKINSFLLKVRQLLKDKKI